jgi:hypothetical protein
MGFVPLIVNGPRAARKRAGSPSSARRMVWFTPLVDAAELLSPPSLSSAASSHGHNHLVLNAV